MKKFRIYKEGNSQIVEADRIECKRRGDDLSVSLFIGKKVTAKFDDVVCFYEVPPEVVIPTRKEKTYLDEDGACAIWDILMLAGSFSDSGHVIDVEKHFGLKSLIVENHHLGKSLFRNRENTAPVNAPRLIVELNKESQIP